MNRPASQAANANTRADASVTAWLALGTPFGRWQDDVVPSLLNWFPGLADMADEALSAWLSRGIGDPALLVVDAGAWQLDGERLARSVPASWSQQRSKTDRPVLWAADSRACWVAPQLREVCPDAGFMVFVDSPVDSLAHWIASEADLNPGCFLDRWCDGASGLLALLDSPQPRCFVDAAQARRHPDALAARLHAALGLPLAAKGEVDTGRTVDAMALAVARAAVDAHPRCSALFLNLLSACEMLADEPAALVSALSPLQTALDPTQVVATYRRTVIGAQSYEKAAASLEQLQSDAAMSERALRDERTRADAQGAALAQAQGELEATRRDNDMLQAQARQVVDELVFYHAERSAQKKASAAPQVDDAGIYPLGPMLSVASVEFDEPRETPPHRELAFVAHDVGLRGRHWDTIRGRLVEHHGRPGLVIFGDAGHEPLVGWTETGAEEGHGYVLLIPSDANSLLGLTRLASSDWTMLSGLIEQIVAALQHGQRSASWLRAATRLHQEWCEMPVAFRYDAVAAAVAEDNASDLAFAGAQVGGRQLGDVHLRCRFGAATTQDLFALLRPANAGALPWSGWPVESDGRFALDWPLPLGRAGDRDGKRRVWSGLTSVDRDSLLALMESLSQLHGDPRAAAACAVLPTGAAEHLAAARLEARSAVRVPTLRQIARLLRRPAD